MEDLIEQVTKEAQKVHERKPPLDVCHTEPEDKTQEEKRGPPFPPFLFRYSSRGQVKVLTTEKQL